MSYVPVPATTVARSPTSSSAAREELEALVVRERRRLPGRAGDDEAVGAVVDEMARQRPEALQVDGAVPLERRHDRCQNLAQHLRNHTFAAYSARRRRRIRGAHALLLVLFLPALFAGHAATASNAVPSGPAGSGAGAVSGYTISSVSYSLAGDTVGGVSFALSPAGAATVKVRLAPSEPWTPCCDCRRHRLVRPFHGRGSRRVDSRSSPAPRPPWS